MFQTQDFSFQQMFFGFIFSVLWAFISAYYAEKKGRSSLGWFVLGFIFTFLALIVLYFLPPVKKDEEISPLVNKPINSATESYPSSSPSTLLPPPFEASPEENVLWFYLDLDHKQIGPVSVIALRELWNRGDLLLNSYVWTEGMEKWEKIDQLSDLKAILNKPSPL